LVGQDIMATFAVHFHDYTHKNDMMTTKKWFLAVMLTVIAVTASAIPAKRGMWTTITLADGTEVRVEKVGDEHGHWLRAANGTCYVKDGETYIQADAEALEAKRAVRLQRKKAARRVIYASTSDGLGQKGRMSLGAVPSIGEYTIPVVMVQFSNLKFKSTTTVAKMTRYYNEEGYHDESGAVGSVRDYFKAQSGGQFIPTFDVVGIVTLDNTYKYYGENDSNGNDQRLDELPGDVISAAITQLGTDFSKYVVPAADTHHKNGVPLLAMFYAGKGEATESETTSNSYYLWPCEWDDEEDPVGGGNYNGIHFNSFFIGNELFGSKLMGMSVFCHEFGHALGLPDFYCTNYAYSNDDPFGLWSIMDTGAYVDDDCRLPMGYNAYEKSFMGWLELKELPKTGSVTLQSPIGMAENSAYIVRNSSTETFIFENRQPGTWYPSQFGSGVLVSRIAYSQSAWERNRLNNTQSQKRACVLTADGAKMYFSASSSNLYGGSKTSITTLKTLNGSSKSIDIKKITKNSNGTITLTMTGEDPTPDPDPDPDPTPTPTPGETVFYESFNQCSGTGGNDGKWSGSIASVAFLTDKDGWESSGDKAYGADQCAKFGTATVSGSTTTPAFTLNGAATMTFRAGAWDAKVDGIILNLSATGGTLTPSSVEMTKGNFTNFTVSLTGTGTMTVTFAAAKGRFFLDEVLVKANVPVGVSDTVTGVPSAPTRIYTLDGRYAGTDLRQLPRGMYVVGGKKIIK